MSKLKIEKTFPLRWVDGRPRTAPIERKQALWKHEGRSLTLSVALGRLQHQLNAITRSGQSWRTTDCVLSTNIRFTQSGARDRNYSRDPEDPGAALYFRLDKQPLALACDRWDTVPDNVAAIAAHIEALRGQERWGVADLAQAFAGHIALPAPESWWQVLGLASSRATIAEIDRAWRDAMRIAHPDHGGSDQAAARLNWARDEGRKANV